MLKICTKLLKRQIKRLSIILLFVFVPYTLLFHHKSIFKHSNLINMTLAKTCILPKLELWPEELKNYFSKSQPLQCSPEENWVYIENATYRFSKQAVQKHGNILCEAITLVRGDEYAVLNGQRLKPLNDGDKIVSDFSEVRCVAPSGKVFKTIVSGIVPNKDLINKRHMKNKDQLNILMLGFDSVSRMTWMRTLPESHSYFTETLGGTVLKGYNIVGDGTPQALLPILTGKNESQLPEARRGHPGAKPVDKHPWVWKEMNKLGYITQWGEDGAKFGTFTYRMLGFEEQPVDHYMRPFYIRAEMQYNEHKPYCFGSLPRHVNMLNWILEMYKVYPNHPKFSFLFHSEISHEFYSDLNMVDLDLKAFLEYMEESGYLNNTVVILMSDHGARFQNVRSTTQGKYEERMPYFAFRFPRWFKEKYQYAINNLEKNSNKLTTPYDIHETLRNIIHINELWEYGNSTGKSLLQEIPRDRTCIEAGIATHWCTCMQWRTIDTTDYHVQSAAKHLVTAINNLLKPHYKHCIEVKLNQVISSVLFKPNDLVLKFKKSQDFDGRNPEFLTKYDNKETFYQITIETLPGSAKFEATIKFNMKTNTFVVNVNEISRINKYGDEPKCVQDHFPHLRPYCYCKNTRIKS